MTTTLAATSLLDRIVIPLDGSELSRTILAQVKRLLVRKDAEVVLVRVVTADEIAAESSPGLAVETARLDLERNVTELRAAGANARAEILAGPPAERIVDFAEECRATLLAIATHGRTGFSRFVRGSTAERALRSSSVPLLLANPRATAPREELRFKKILVPLDGSETSAAILPAVAELARLYGAEVVLDFVIEIPLAVDPAIAPTPLSDQEARAILERFRARLPGVSVSLATDLGTPAIQILDRATQDKVDLIAMTTHGRTGAARWAFGSVAEHVLRHATCPLLVLRTRDAGE